jgi:hypothetical protein
MKTTHIAIALLTFGLLYFAYEYSCRRIVDAKIQSDLFNPESYQPNHYKRIKNGYIVLYLCTDMKGDTLPVMDTVYFK